MNENLQNEGKALGESSPGELPKETTVAFDGQCRIMKTGTHRYAGFETKKNAENEDEGVWKEISNFTMELVGTERRVDTDKKMVTYTVKLTPASDVVSPMDELVTVVEPGELTPMANFEKFVLSRGRFQFWGRDIQYKRVRSMMMDETVPEIKAKDIAGYDPKLDIWFAHNGAVTGNGKLHRAEPSGEIIVGGEHYKLAPQDETALPRLPKMAFDYKGSVYDGLLWPFMDLLSEMYGPVTELAVGWVFSMVYGHQFYSLTGNHPMLFIHGPKGQGKTQLGYMLMGAFGVTAKPNPIQQLSITSLYTLVNNASNIPAWLDEYKPNTFDRDIQEAIKNNYDRFSREVGTLDVFKTKVRRARSTFMITGEYEPDDHATKSRTVAVGLDPKHDEAKFNEARKYAASLSAVTLDMLKNREKFWPSILSRYERLMVEFRKDFPSVSDSRIIANYAKICAVLDVIRTDLKRTERIKQWMVCKQESTMDDNPSVQILEKLPYIMKSARVFIPHMINWKKKVLAVQAKELLYAFQHSDRDRTSTGKPMSTDEFRRLAKDAKILIPGHGPKPTMARVTNRTAESGPVKTSQRCFLFDMNHPRVMEVAKELEAHFGKDVERDADDQATEE